MALMALMDEEIDDTPTIENAPEVSDDTFKYLALISEEAQPGRLLESTEWEL